MKFKTPLIFALAAFSIGLCGCQKNPSGELVGVWKSKEVLLSMRSDGSCVFTPLKGDEDVYAKWTLSGDKISIRGIGSASDVEFDLISIGKEEINIRRSGRFVGEVMSLQRVAERPAPPSQAEIFALTPAGQRTREQENSVYMARSVDKAVLNNARQLAAAADQYFLENGVSFVTRGSLVGTTNYVKALNLVANENYPGGFTQGVTVTVNGIAGMRTITYAP